MSHFSEYYALLGLQADASFDEIRAAWRKKCHEYHPDKGGNQEDFLKIMHAYRMLTDPEYQRRNRNNDTGKDLEIVVKVTATFEEAFFGTTLLVNYTRDEVNERLELLKKQDLEIVSLKLQLPPGSTNGYTTIIPNKGLKCKERYGNAVVVVTAHNHPKFKVMGQNVITEEQVPLDIMLKGGKLTVQTLYGLKTVFVPPGSAPGHQVVVPKCGVEQKGDHLVHLIPVFPTAEQLRGDSWQGLAINWSAASDPQEREDTRHVELHDSLTKKT